MSTTGNPPVLIIAEDAREYSGLIESAGGEAIPHIACETTAQALEQYDGHTVLFGIPAMIAEVIDQMPSVQWVQSTWAGVRPLLSGSHTDYLLTGIKGIFGPMMSEYVIGYLLAHELKMFQRAERQRKREWYNPPSGSLRDRKAGIMGTGSIGSHIAGMLQRFGVQVRGLNRSGDPAENFHQVYSREHLRSFLEGLDYLVIALPETPATAGLLNAEAFTALPDHSVLVNVGRANAIDHDALLTALNEKRLGAAVLDVFEEEPLPQDSPLWTAPNMTITAHVAARSRAIDITPIFIENYRRFVNREALKYVIDFNRQY